jgi:5-dehydro-2-deoxygluconokinase
MFQHDLVCIGRVAIDLYGEELGTSLAEARRFQRYLGGTSGNLAVSAARLGLRVAFGGAVGDDPGGAFLRARLLAEGVDVSALDSRADRRTALAFLGMDQPEAVSLDFYRDRAADAEIALTPALARVVGAARAVAFCGSHFADPAIAARLRPVLDLARGKGAICVLDLDLRRQIWADLPGGLAASAGRVAAAARDCHIVVGNAEEWALVAGLPDPAADPEALRAAAGGQTAVLKLGADGAAGVGPGAPWTRVAGHPVPVLNPVGAGDAFLGGFLAAQLGARAALPEALAQGNLCGALVVTRHGCSSAMPFARELAVARQSGPLAAEVARVHASAARPARPAPIMALACDHRVPFADLAAAHGRDAAAIRRFKALVVDAALQGADRHGLRPAVLMDDRFGAAELLRLAQAGAWVGRPVEVTKSRPLAFEAGEDIAAQLRRWHPMQVAKCLVWMHPDDPPALTAPQTARLLALQAAAQGAGIEWMLEAVPPVALGHDDATLTRLVRDLYAAGLRPDYWKLPVLETAQGWASLGALIRDRDPDCRGVVVLGLDRPLADLLPGLALAAQAPVCSGFAIGRSIFGAAAQDWFAGRLTDAEATARMGALYAKAVATFRNGALPAPFAHSTRHA